MENTVWKNKYEIIRSLRKREENENIRLKYNHYTSLEVLFNILDGDSFWASNVRFSNDEMEEKVLKLDDQYMRDDYIICFSNDDDILSQWRGYCNNGGAAIEMELRSPSKYSVLHADYETSKKYLLYENSPLPVVYLNELDNAGNKRREIENIIKEKKESKITLPDILPYLKNGKFSEEKELRMVFSNIEGKLSKCIRFRTLSNGAKVPYIVVKSGNMGKMLGNCPMDISQYSVDRLRECSDNREIIWIEEGTDQENKYYDLMKKIDEAKKKFPELGDLAVYCRGHLPIKKIRVAPTYDKKRIAEQIKRFCMSKYWLRNVGVVISTIPYIRQY